MRKYRRKHKLTLLRALKSVKRRCPAAVEGEFTIDKCIEKFRADLKRAGRANERSYRYWTRRHYWVVRKGKALLVRHDDHRIGSPPMLQFEPKKLRRKACR